MILSHPYTAIYLPVLLRVWDKYIYILRIKHIYSSPAKPNTHRYTNRSLYCEWFMLCYVYICSVHTAQSYAHNNIEPQSDRHFAKGNIENKNITTRIRMVISVVVVVWRSFWYILLMRCDLRVVWVPIVRYNVDGWEFFLLGGGRYNAFGIAIGVSA